MKYLFTKNGGILLKKYLYGVLVALLFFVSVPSVEASSGQLRTNSIKECNGTHYGQHGSDNHWHEAENKGNGW